MRWDDVTFKSFEDFYRNRKVIRSHYKKLEYVEKRKYKEFVYSPSLRESETDKDYIWAYLNEDMYSRQDLSARMEFKRQFVRNKIRK